MNTDYCALERMVLGFPQESEERFMWGEETPEDEEILEAIFPPDCSHETTSLEEIYEPGGFVEYLVCLDCSKYRRVNE